MLPTTVNEVGIINIQGMLTPHSLHITVNTLIFIHFINETILSPHSLNRALQTQYITLVKIHITIIHRIMK